MTIGELAYYQIFPKSTKDLSRIKFCSFAILCCPKIQCGFRRCYSAQHCLITLIEKWKKSVDNGDAVAALLTGLSKALICLPHEFLIDKLDAHCFDKNSLKLVHIFLPNRKQRVKINDKYSSWRDILFGVRKRQF